eukprot:140455-Chlamydomonas_euryale.AAC.1
MKHAWRQKNASELNTVQSTAQSPGANLNTFSSTGKSPKANPNTVSSTSQSPGKSSSLVANQKVQILVRSPPLPRSHTLLLDLPPPAPTQLTPRPSPLHPSRLRIVCPPAQAPAASPACPAGCLRCVRSAPPECRRHRHAPDAAASRGNV